MCLNPSLRAESEFLGIGKSQGDAQGDDDFKPEVIQEHLYCVLQCMKTVQVGAKFKKYVICPDECPYVIQDLSDDLHCSFKCVTADDCGKENPIGTMNSSWASFVANVSHLVNSTTIELVGQQL